MWNTSAISWTTDCLEHHIEVQIIKSHFFLPFSVFSPALLSPRTLDPPASPLTCWDYRCLPPHLTQTDGPAASCQHWLRQGSSSLLWLVFWNLTHSHTPSYKHIQQNTFLFNSLALRGACLWGEALEADDTLQVWAYGLGVWEVHDQTVW